MPDNFKNFRINYLQVIFLALCLFGYELISFMGLLLPQNTNYTFVYRIFFAAVASFVVLMNRTYFTRSLFLVMIFWSFYMIRIVYESAFNSFDLGISQLELWTFSVFLCILPMFASSTHFSDATLEKTAKIVFIMLIIINVLGLINNQSIIETRTMTRADANERLNTVSFAKTSATLIAMAIFYLNSPKRKSLLYKAILLATIALGIINIFIAGSRGPLLQLIIVVMLYYIFNFKSLKKTYILLFGLVFVVFINIFPQYDFIFNLLFERIKTTGNDSFDNDATRLILMQDAWEGFLDHPYLGRSLETTQKVYPHNVVLESFMATGIVGGILFLIIYIKSLLSSLKLLGIPTYNWFAAIVIMSLISMLSAGSIIHNIVLWPLIVLIFNLKDRFIKEGRNNADFKVF